MDTVIFVSYAGQGPQSSLPAFKDFLISTTWRYSPPTSRRTPPNQWPQVHKIHPAVPVLGANFGVIFKVQGGREVEVVWSLASTSLVDMNLCIWYYIRWLEILESFEVDANDSFNVWFNFLLWWHVFVLNWLVSSTRIGLLSHVEIYIYIYICICVFLVLYLITMSLSSLKIMEKVSDYRI